MFRSREYMDWMNECMIIAREAGIPAILGKYKIMLRVARPDKRRRDIDNLAKAAQDFLQHAGIIEDDCLCEAIYCKWVNEGPPVRINIYPMRGNHELSEGIARSLQGGQGKDQGGSRGAAKSPAQAYAEAVSVTAHIERARLGASQLLKQAQASVSLQLASPREVQLRAYLDSFRIGPGCVQGIGAGRIAQLVSFGIETAADLDVTIISQIPGFGDQLTERLVKWRRDLERRFRFNPKSVDTDNPRGRRRAGLNAEEGRYFMAISSLDVQMRRLISLNDQMETQRAALEPVIAGLSDELERLREELRTLS